MRKLMTQSGFEMGNIGSDGFHQPSGKSQFGGWLRMFIQKQHTLSDFLFLMIFISVVSADGVSAQMNIVFEENWDSGVIDSGKWTQGTLEQGDPVRYNGLACLDLLDNADDPGDPNDQTPCSGGDFGWISGSSDFKVWDTWIRSVDGIPRGDDLVIEFTSIGARFRPGTGLPFPGNSALNGPLHNTNDGGVLITDDCEAGICGNYNDASQPQAWGDGAGAANGTPIGDDWNKDPNENNPGRWWTQLDFDDTITPAVHKTTNALRHRVQVGNTAGFFYEYRRMDETEWTPMMDDNGTPEEPADDMALDTREDTGNGGASPMLYLGWCANQGAIIIDDIVAYTTGGVNRIEGWMLYD